MIESFMGLAGSWADGLLTGVLWFALRATVLLLAAWIATRLMRSASAATRHLVWTVAITGVLTLPVLSVVLPAWRVPLFTLSARLEAPASTAAPASVAETPVPTRAEQTVTPQPSTPASASPSEVVFAERAAPSLVLPRISLTASFALLWLVVSALLVLRLAVANVRVSSWRRSSRPVDDVRWNNLLRRLTREHDIERPVVLLENGATDVPVTWGVIYPVVLLPVSAEEWDEEQRAAVLTHELAHVKRFDAFSQLLAQLALALLWFHPLAWMAVRRMRMERELACDDFVLAAGARASRYADDLLGLARQLARPTVPAAAALAMARRSELEGRLLAILDPTAKRDAVRRARVAAASLMVLVLSMPLAAFSPGARVETMPATPDIAATMVESPTPVAQSPAGAGEPNAAPESPLPPAVMTPATDDRRTDQLEALLRTPTSIGRLGSRSALSLGQIPIRAVTDTEPAKPVEVQTLVEVARGAKRMTSDYEKGRLLAEVAKRYVRSDSLRDAYLDAVFSMTSDYERSKALIVLLERDSIPASHTVRILKSAAVMTSDVSRATVLKKIGPVTFADTTVQRAWIDVVVAMTSDYERSQAVSLLVKEPNLTRGVQIALLRATNAITSSTDKANVLVLFVAKQGLADDTVRRSFLKVAEGLTSDNDYRRVMTAMMR